MTFLCTAHIYFKLMFEQLLSIVLEEKNTYFSACIYIKDVTQLCKTLMASK